MRPADRVPDDAIPYRRTPTFDADTTPEGLRNEHSTKVGVWGQIHVVEGSLRYCVTDPRREASELVLTPADPPGVVEPGIVHRVAITGPVRFYVQFLKAGD